MACTLGVGVGVEETTLVGGAFMEGTSARGGALATLSMLWAVVVLSLETTSSACLVLVWIGMLSCCSLGLAGADTMDWGYCSLGLALVGAVVLGCCSVGLALAVAVVRGFG